MRKPVFGVSDQVLHKPGCTATEDCWRLEISDLVRIGIILYIHVCGKKKGFDHCADFLMTHLKWSCGCEVNSPWNS